jgi:hypothetical protein
MELLGTTRGKYKDHISFTLKAKRVRIWSLYTCSRYILVSRYSEDCNESFGYHTINIDKPERALFELTSSDDEVIDLYFRGNGFESRSGYTGSSGFLGGFFRNLGEFQTSIIWAHNTNSFSSPVYIIYAFRTDKK